MMQPSFYHESAKVRKQEKEKKILFLQDPMLSRLIILFDFPAVSPLLQANHRKMYPSGMKYIRSCTGFFVCIFYNTCDR